MDKTVFNSRFRELFAFLEKNDDANDVYNACDVWTNEQQREVF